jgi:hypothetical protein
LIVADAEKIGADELVRMFSSIPARLEATSALVSRGRVLDCG